MRDFPDGPMVVKTSCFQCRGKSSIPDRGTKTYMPWGVAKKKKKTCDERPNSFVVFQNCFRYSVLFAFRIICYFLQKKKIIIINKISKKENLLGFWHRLYWLCRSVWWECSNPNIDFHNFLSIYIYPSIFPSSDL